MSKPTFKKKSLGAIALTVVMMSAFAPASLLKAHADTTTTSTTTTTTASDQQQQPKETTQSPDVRANELIAQMTLDEKISMLSTLNDSTHSRVVPGIPRLGIPPLLLTNGSAGVSTGGPVQQPATALPAPIAEAASWDPSAAQQYGVIEGIETLSQGRNLIEGPDVNIMRIPQNGRTFEAFGEDPYLAAQIGVGNIDGIQSQGVIGNVKHYVANNQETNRMTVSENIDPRTLHEIYLPAFEAAVKQGHVGSVMGAKNLVNDVYSSDNETLLDGILKKDWGFQGFAVSDFNAIHDTVQGLNGGMDLEMPNGKYYSADAIKAALAAGTVTMATIDDHVHRILRTMIEFGLLDHPPVTPTIDPQADGAVARSISEQGTVLLKNNGNLLPLDAKKLKAIAVIGPEADQAVTGGDGSPQVDPYYTVSPLDALKKRLGSDVQINYAAGEPPINLGQLTANADGSLQTPVPSYVYAPNNAQPGVHGLTAQYFADYGTTSTDKATKGQISFSTDPVLTRVDPYIDFDYGGAAPIPSVDENNYGIRWTGTFTAPKDGTYTFSLSNHGGADFFIGDLTKALITNSGSFPTKSVSKTIYLHAGQSYPIQVDFHKNSSDGQIELSWQPPAGTSDNNPDIAAAVQAAKSSDVAVVFVGDKETEGIDRPNLSLDPTENQLVQAVSAANPNTIVVLNTGGPVLMPWVDQVPSLLEAWYPGEEDGNAITSILFGDVNPSGKLPMTFPKQEADLPVPPSAAAQYPGLPGANGISEATYSEGLDVGYRNYDAANIDPLFEFGYGLSYTTFGFQNLKMTPNSPNAAADRKVSVDVTNTGTRAGAEVVQLYIGDPASVGEPPKQLKGFQKVYLQPGETKKVTFTLDSRALSYWDTTKNDWAVQDGTYQVMVGDSSRNLPLQGSFEYKNK